MEKSSSTLSTKLHVFDIETNAGNFSDLTTFDTVHCLVIVDPKGDVLRFNNQRGGEHNGNGTIEEGVRYLESLPCIGGHNVQGFDIPVLQQTYRFQSPPEQVVLDSLVMAEMVWGDSLRWRDKQSRDKGRLNMPAKYTGLHSLAAWGFRLGDYKVDFMEGRTPEEAFAKWTPEMESYCEQDCHVNVGLFDTLDRRIGLDTRCSLLESELAYHVRQQELRGWAFNEKKAVALYNELASERDELSDKLRAEFGSFYLRSGRPKTPRKTLKYKLKARADYTEGAEYSPVKLAEFNPGSRDHIALVLQRLGWKPSHYTNTGKPQVDETTLELAHYDCARDFIRLLLLTKRIGQIAEGDKAWLKLARNGRIHGRVKQNGTRTGRCSHMNPNVSQVPKTGKPWGAECRACFEASPGMVLVGGDASGIELRMLAHFAHRFDGGELAEIILNGDVHQENTDAIGLNERNNAKTVIYACLYGAGDEKLGLEIYNDMTAEQRKEFGKKTRKKLVLTGRAARAAINKRFPGFDKLGKSVKQAAKRGHLKGIDGRRLEGFSQHSALNTLLQGSAGIVVKEAYNRLVPILRTHGLTMWQDCYVVGFIHDELQVECLPEHAEIVGKSIVAAIKEAGESFNFRVPLDGDYKIGESWACTH